MSKIKEFSISRKGVEDIRNLPKDLPDIPKRVLVVIYRLSHGVPGMEITRQMLLDEYNRLGVGEMSNDEFEEFRKRTVAEFGKSNYN